VEESAERPAAEQSGREQASAQPGPARGRLAGAEGSRSRRGLGYPEAKNHGKASGIE
jgi:hypothetical protein